MKIYDDKNLIMFVFCLNIQWNYNKSYYGQVKKYEL